MKRWIDRGVRGITSNPTIFAKAIEGAADYDEQFSSLIQEGATVEQSYWELVKKDIEDALALLRPFYDQTNGHDGFVSVEVAPDLARDTTGTTEAARGLWSQIDEPNLLVKIPGTAEGLPAITTCLSEGIDSVASFFVSRVDTEVDRRLDAIGSDAALALRGKAAVANAQLAYELFLDRCATDRWKALAAKGAEVQRPLWASTSTKNPSYPKTLYVDTLIGPDSVNTMPDQTLEDFENAGTIARTVDADFAGAHRVIEQLGELGIDMADVTRTLEEEGVASFSKSFDELITSLETKADQLKG
jgi:transaldolase